MKFRVCLRVAAESFRWRAGPSGRRDLIVSSVKEAFLTIGVNRREPIRVGAEFSRVFINGFPYLDRLIVYLGGTIRLHRFWRGDDDRASHDHPWPFITFPFSDYIEDVYEKGRWKETRRVKAWRFHYRPANFEHIVIGRADFKRKPFWTLVLTGLHTSSKWGFWPKPGVFVPFKKWFSGASA